MKKKTMRIIVIVLAAVMLLSILVPALAVLAGASGKITEEDIDKIKGELDDISNQRYKAQQQLSAIRGDMSRAKDQIELIESQITLTEHGISISQRLLEHNSLLIVFLLIT